MMAVGTANESCCDSQILFGVRQNLNLDVVKQLLHQFIIIIIIIFHLLSVCFHIWTFMMDIFSCVQV